MFRRPLSTGCWDVESTTANFGLSVPPPLASSLAGAPGFAVKRPICAYVKPWVASRVWMRMYCAKQRASPPVSIVLPATLQLGRLTDDGSFAAFASALIALGVMSPVPTIASAPRLFWTVLRPLKPRTIAATPNATRMMLAAIPPYSKSFVCWSSRDSFRVPAVLSRSVSPRDGAAIRRPPPIRCGFPADPVRRFCDDPRMQTRASERLRTLLETGIAISSELSLDPVLERIVEAAAHLTGARYAGLGCLDRAGMGLERFITTGIDVETRTTIGDEPHGRGILGVLIRDAAPL